MKFFSFKPKNEEKIRLKTYFLENIILFSFCFIHTSTQCFKWKTSFEQHLITLFLMHCSFHFGIFLHNFPTMAVSIESHFNFNAILNIPFLFTLCLSPVIRTIAFTVHRAELINKVRKVARNKYYNVERISPFSLVHGEHGKRIWKVELFSYLTFYWKSCHNILAFLWEKRNAFERHFDHN